MTISCLVKKITLRLTLLLCMIHGAGIVVYAQEPVQETQKWIDRNTEDPEEEPREQPGLLNDTVGVNERYWKDVLENEGLPVDSATIDSLRGDRNVPGPFLTVEAADSIAVSDSIAVMNQVNLEGVEGAVILDIEHLAVADSIPPASPQKVWIPNSNKATWLALVIPGGGQIYNRKYWKLPIIYGGFAGCAYALSWNNQMYKDYSQAYMDIMDNNPNTNSFLDLLPPGYTYNEAQLSELLRKRKDRFRRYRDMSIFAFVGVYLISVIDAYVDAELSDFDITPDLSMRVEPTVFSDRFSSSRSVGIQCSLRF